MMDFFERVERAEQALRDQYGPFKLFALVRRTEGQGMWDLVVAAPTLDVDKKRRRHALASEISARLNEEQAMQLSRIVFLDTGEQAVGALRDASQHPNATDLLNRSGAFGFEIENVRIFSASGHLDAEAATAQ